MTTEQKTTTHSPKKERLEARVSREQKELFQRAALLQGRTLSEFMVSTLQEAAIRAVKESEVMELSARDREVFINALLNPPEPNDKLREGFREYKEFMNE